MKAFLLVPLGAALLAACGEDAEVAETEEPLGTEVVGADAGLGADAAVGTGVGATPLAWDANNNRLFDRNEFTGLGDQGFLGWDDDNDQRLTQAEFEQGWTEAGFQNGAEVFTAFDDNNDTFLGDDELFSEDEFAEWDANNNAVLEREEFGFYGV